MARWALIAAATAALMVSQAAAQPPPATAPTAAPAVPLVKVEGLKSVSAHVQVIPDNSVGLVPNVGFVVGSKGVLVIDTGLGPKNGAAVYAVASRLAKGATVYLVTTHVHPEHDLGAQSFPAGSTKLIRSRAQTAEIAANGLTLARTFAGRSPAIAELLEGAQFRTADITFDQTYDLDLGGGVTARIFALGNNHTAGDTAVWVTGDKVLFSGDVAMRAQPSMMGQGTTMAQWNASLDRMEALNPVVVVPSHGPVGDVGFIQGYRAYLKEVSERTAAAKAQGLDKTAATTRVTDAMVARYPDRARLTGAINVAWGG